MGNYSGTIRCGHCYERGHNRASCPKLTEQLTAQWSRIETAGYDDSNYTHQRVRAKLAKRQGSDPLTGEKKRRRRKTYGGRVCGYCGENGHNRRTCPQQKKDQDRFTVLTAETRASVLDAMRQHGLGPGALLAHDEYGTVTPCLVAGIKWDTIHSKAKWPAAIVARRVTDNKPCVLSFPKEVTGSSSRWNTVTILSRAPAVQPPAGWSEASNLDFASVDIFEKGAKRDYWFWQEHGEE